MKIAVNTRFLIKDRLEGVGWFTFETLKRITQQHPEHEFHFLFDRPYSSEFIFADNVIPHVLTPPARHPILWYIWFEISVTNALKRIKPDLFLSTDGHISLKTKVKTVDVIHDLAFESYPKSVPPLVRRYYKHFFPLFAKRSQRVATVSQASKKDISERYGIDLEVIDVVYNGRNESYEPVDQSVKENVKASYTEGKDYFLFIGGLHARKNVSRLMQGFDLFKNRSGSEMKLLIVGRKDWAEDGFWEKYKKLKFKDDVIFAGGIYDPEKLKGILGSAFAITYISYFEGFGIPIVEAMYCDVPVITSNASCMPEVAGDAAILVDPFSIESIADGLSEIVDNEDLRNDLVKKGQIHREKFSWNKTADKLWECLIKAS